MPTRVLLAHPSPLALRQLEKIVAQDAELECVGAASQGREAWQKFQEQAPDVVVSALPLALLSGLELTQQIMHSRPTPILVLAACAPEKASEKSEAEAALRAGATDSFCLETPFPLENHKTAELVAKIKRAARVPVISRRAASRESLESREAVAKPRKSAENRAKVVSRETTAREKAAKIVAIGASTGGPPVLLSILRALPSNFALPIVCVQHISPGFLGELVSWLDSQCEIRVQIARGGEKLEGGAAYFAPETAHLEITKSFHVRLDHGAARDGHRPSATTLFESVARACGPQSAAVLLTGMGRDGADGLRAIHDAGGQTFAQDEASCVVFGMPKEAIALGAARFVLPPAEIARRLAALKAVK